MHKLIFTGPTISFLDIKNLSLKTPIVKLLNPKELENYTTQEDDIIFILPPVAGGDLYKIHTHQVPLMVGIIDGYFENRIAVWHKEILFLLSKGIPVFGSSSMGALRAAELERYGMVGLGKIYKNFSNEIYEDDDEVTVSHGPAEVGYPQISEAMVNIRFTIEAAIKDNILSKEIGERFVSVAKSTFYKNRNYGSVIRHCVECKDMKESNFSRFIIWLEKYRIDQKKIDALGLLKVIDSYKLDAFVPKDSFKFEDTVMWRNSITT